MHALLQHTESGLSKLQQFSMHVRLQVGPLRLAMRAFNTNPVQISCTFT